MLAKKIPRYKLKGEFRCQQLSPQKRGGSHGGGYFAPICSRWAASAIATDPGPVGAANAFTWMHVCHAIGARRIAAPPLRRSDAARSQARLPSALRLCQFLCHAWKGAQTIGSIVMLTIRYTQTSQKNRARSPKFTNLCSRAKCARLSPLCV